MTHHFRRPGVLGLVTIGGTSAILSAWLLLAGVPAWAQSPRPAPDPSPLAPGDLKKPIFDTETPVYNLKGAQARSANTVVAEVEGRAITLAEVADAISDLPLSVRSLPFSDIYPGVLQQLIRQQVLVVRAQQQALDEDPAVRRRLKAVTDRVLADEYLHRTIQPTITEQALLERYNKEIAGKPGPEEVHVRVIMASTEEAAQAIIAELRSGADFGAVAKRSSLDTTAPAGGDLGFLTREGLNPEVGSVAFALQAGSVAPFPIRSAGGWFVVKVDERRRRPTPGFFEVREQLVAAMLQEAAPGVAARALASVTVREYDMGGKEAAEAARK